jgi:hypothetical protein
MIEAFINALFYLELVRISGAICIYDTNCSESDRLCGLVVRVPGDPEVRIRFLPLPDFLRSSGSSTSSSSDTGRKTGTEWDSNISFSEGCE